MIKACIFDLDGVLVDTAYYHFLSWKKLANKLQFKLDDGIEEKLKGINRMDSLNIVLEHAGIKASSVEKEEYASLKNQWYLESISDMKEYETLPGVVEMLDTLIHNEIKVCVGSASKNAKPVLEKIGLTDKFEIIVDGCMVEKTKPDPEVFLKAADYIEFDPSECLVFEDSVKGIKAAIEGGFRTVGVGEAKYLKEAEIIIRGFQGLNILNLIDTIESKSGTSKP